MTQAKPSNLQLARQKNKKNRRVKFWNNSNRNRGKFMTDKILKIQMVTDHQDYKKGQIVELDEKAAINLLTNGKALKIHRKKDEVAQQKTEENSEEKNSDKGNKKSKKNDQ